MRICRCRRDPIRPSAGIIIKVYTMNRKPDPVGAFDIMSVPLDVYYGNILNKLSVEQVWDLRTVSKQYYSICMEYFRDRLRELVLHESAFLESTFGRTRTILAKCERLQTLKIELLNSRRRDLSPLNIDFKVTTLLSLLAESNCFIKVFVLRNIPLINGFPSIASNLQTVEELVIDHVGSMQWSGISKNIIGLKTRNDNLHSLTLNLEKYDGADLPQMAHTCPNMRHVNVSLKCCILFIKSDCRIISAMVSVCEPLFVAVHTISATSINYTFGSYAIYYYVDKTKSNCTCIIT